MHITLTLLAPTQFITIMAIVLVAIRAMSLSSAELTERISFAEAFACQIGKENSNKFYAAASVRLEKLRKFI